MTVVGISTGFRILSTFRFMIIMVKIMTILDFQKYIRIVHHDPLLSLVRQYCDVVTDTRILCKCREEFEQCTPRKPSPQPFTVCNTQLIVHEFYVADTYSKFTLTCILYFVVWKYFFFKISNFLSTSLHRLNKMIN